VPLVLSLRLTLTLYIIALEPSHSVSYPILLVANGHSTCHVSSRPSLACFWCVASHFHDHEPLTHPSFQAASKNNYGAICGLYFLASIGLGGNIPIDATIALEFLPQNRRALVSLLSMWQPIGVVVASAIAYGTAAKYRCDVALPACSAVGTGEACCTISSNMGWRYEVIVIGAMTLAVFFARYFVFTFHESPKFLLGRGRYQDAIDVLHKIAKFNGAPEPTLTVEDFLAVDRATGTESTGVATALSPKDVILGVFKNLGFLRGLFLNKLECFTFGLLALAYMVSCPQLFPRGILY
jgi:MFS family permease